uniref:Uncharacterized protein n=1 Tax=Trichobilharzia regenti TaxID=157069 RepID=A0AA85JXU2_TRIRE|nr:unnamed protein product [Trichobilharzia regenti]
MSDKQVSNPNSRTPSPTKLYYYTDNDGWSELDPNTPPSQKPIGGTWVSVEEDTDGNGNRRAMHIKTSVKHDMNKPVRQQGVMVTTNLTPESNSGKQSPVQAIVFQTNQPLTNITIPTDITICPEGSNNPVKTIGELLSSATKSSSNEPTSTNQNFLEDNNDSHTNCSNSNNNDDDDDLIVMEGGVLDTNNSNCSMYHPVLCQTNYNHHHLVNSRPIYHHYANKNVTKRQCNTTFKCFSLPVFNNNDSTQILQSERVEQNPVKPFLITSSARQRNQIGRRRSYFKSSRMQPEKEDEEGRQENAFNNYRSLIPSANYKHNTTRIRGLFTKECEYNPHSFCCLPSQRQCNFTASINQSIPMNSINEQAHNCHCYHHNCCNCQYSNSHFNDQHQKCCGYQERHNNAYHKKSTSISSGSNSSIRSNGNTLSMNGSDNSSPNSVTSNDSGNHSNNSYTKSIRNKNAHINLRLVSTSSGNKQSDRQNYPMKFIKQLIRNCNSDHIPIVLNVNVPKTKSSYSKMSKNLSNDTTDDENNNYERKKQSTSRIKLTESITVNRLPKKDSPKEMNQQSKKNSQNQYSPTASAKESPQSKVTKHKRKGKLMRKPSSDTDDKDDNSQSSRQNNYSKLFKNLKYKKSVKSQTKQKPHQIHSNEAEDTLMHEKSVDEMTETSESDRIPVKLNSSKPVKPHEDEYSPKDSYILRPTTSTGIIKQSPKLDAFIKSSRKDDKNTDMYCKITPLKQSSKTFHSDGMSPEAVRSNQLSKHILCKIKCNKHSPMSQPTPPAPTPQGSQAAQLFGLIDFSKCENQIRTSRRFNGLIEDTHDGDGKVRGEYYTTAAADDETRRPLTQQSSGSDSRDSILTCFVKAASKHVENEIDNNMLFTQVKFISDSDEE